MTLTLPAEIEDFYFWILKVVAQCSKQTLKEANNLILASVDKKKYCIFRLEISNLVNKKLLQ